jgi:hypothetical protein
MIDERRKVGSCRSSAQLRDAKKKDAFSRSAHIKLTAQLDRDLQLNPALKVYIFPQPSLQNERKHNFVLDRICHSYKRCSCK